MKTEAALNGGQGAAPPEGRSLLRKRSRPFRAASPYLDTIGTTGFYFGGKKQLQTSLWSRFKQNLGGWIIRMKNTCKKNKKWV